MATELAAFREKTERNKRVQARYDALLAGGKGHYETLFKIVREEIEAERERCARIADMRAGIWKEAVEGSAHENCAMSLWEECEDIANAIRTHGQ